MTHPSLSRALWPLLLVVGAVNRGAVAQLPERIGSLDGVRAPTRMAVYGNDLVLVGDDFLVRVYSLSPFELRFTAGGRGDGPQQLRYSPSLWVTAGAIVVSDFTKSMWFSRAGEFVRAVPYSDFPDFSTAQEMQLLPAGDRLVRSVVDHASRRRTLTLLDSALRPLATLYEGLYDWSRLGGPGGLNLLSHRIEIVAGEREIFVSDTDRGFFIRGFDPNGGIVSTVDRTASETPVPTSAADRDALLEEIRPTVPPAAFGLVQANARVSETYPRIHHLRLSGERLYVTTHRERDGLHEMLVLSTRGRLLDRLFLPLPSFHHYRGLFQTDLFAISGGALYELAQDPETRSWEVLRTRLQSLSR